MTNPRRNLAILGAVVLLLVGAVYVIVTKPTRLGLDLRGGVELVYEAQPTPKVPQITPQAVDDALTTIRKRTDALGVAEPEIQRSGADQITVALPGVANVQRAIEQVGETAQLQFYDFEPNVFLPDGETAAEADAQPAPEPSLFDAVRLAGKVEPQAEETDLPPGGAEPLVRERFGDDRQALLEFYDRKNDTRSADAYYLFGPGEAAGRDVIAGPAPNCGALAEDLEENPPPPGGPAPAPPARGECIQELSELDEQPPKGSIALKVPRGITIIQDEPPPNAPANAPVNRHYVFEDDSELSGAEIRDPKQTFDQGTGGEPVVAMEFTDQGRQAFAAVTKRIAERGAEQIPPPGAPPDATLQRFAIVLDDQILSTPTIDFRENPEGIDGRTGAQINGIGDLQEAQDLANNLRIGALPINLELISNTQVSATLGKQALNQGLLAAGAGLALTLLFLVSFYRVLGVIAAGALVIYSILLFALVELIPVTLTLPGIAGMILTLGVAADANIVIFERVKEEARAGAPPARAIATGYAKALRTIADANVVTIGVAFILFMLATAGVKGFAFTLLIGTLVSLFTAVLATSAILGLLARTRVMRSRSALGAGEERVRWRFDFTGLSKWFFSMSGVILAAGALAIAALGLTFGIDFESGTRIRTPLEQPATVQQVRDALPPNLRDAEIQTVEDPDLGPNVVQISTAKLAPGEDERVRDALDRAFGVETADFSTQSIGPTFGAQIARTALIAVIASLFLISLYIGIRFEAKFAVPVLIALMHDLLITAGVYALTEREVTTATVAALLTILGYSLYDTIIVFDRIRENVPRMPRATFSQIVNRSMSEVLTRSLATSFSTLLPITALMLFGGETLKDFGFALLVGVASGTYSSVFIASPVLTAWKEREPLYRRRRKVAEEEGGGVVPAFATGALGAPGGGTAAGRRAQRDPAGATATPVTPASGRRGAQPPLPAPPAPTTDPSPTEPASRRASGPARRAPVPPPEVGRPATGGDGVRAGDGADGAFAGDGAEAADGPAGAPAGSAAARRQQRRKRRHGRR